MGTPDTTAATRSTHLRRAALGTAAVAFALLAGGLPTAPSQAAIGGWELSSEHREGARPGWVTIRAYSTTPSTTTLRLWLEDGEGTEWPCAELLPYAFPDDGPLGWSCEYEDLPVGTYYAYGEESTDGSVTDGPREFEIAGASVSSPVLQGDHQLVATAGSTARTRTLTLQNVPYWFEESNIWFGEYRGDDFVFLCQGQYQGGDGDGVMRCETGTLPYGSHRAYAVSMNSDFGGEVRRTGEEHSASAGFTVSAPPSSPPPAPGPTAPPALTDWGFEISGAGADGSLGAGSTIGISGSGLPGGTEIEVSIESTPRHLGSSVADRAGGFALQATIPADLEPGAHELVVEALAPDGRGGAKRMPVVVRPPAPAPGPLEPDRAPDDEPGVEPAASGSPRNDPGRATILTNSLVTWQLLLEHPGVFGFAGLVALALLLLVALPSTLVNSALENNGRLLSRAFGPVGRAVDRAAAGLRQRTGSDIPLAMIVLVIGALLFSLADPGIGLDLVSLRTFLSLFIALAVVTIGATVLALGLGRRLWGAHAEMLVLPLGLVAALIGVLVGRTFGFSPGFFLGLIIGIGFHSVPGARDRSRIALAFAGVLLGLSVAAWLLYSFVWAGEIPTDFFGGVVHDTLVSITAEGLTFLVTAMLPFTFLHGREVFEHSRAAWAAAYLIGAAVFALLLLPLAVIGADAVPDLLLWGGVLAGFALLSVVLWWALGRHHGRHQGRQQADSGSAVGGQRSRV